MDEDIDIMMIMCNLWRVNKVNNFDIGKDLQNAYRQGYIDALTDLANEVEEELSKASWYSKGKFIGLIKRRIWR